MAPQPCVSATATRRLAVARKILFEINTRRAPQRHATHNRAARLMKHWGSGLIPGGPSDASAVILSPLARYGAHSENRAQWQKAYGPSVSYRARKREKEQQNPELRESAKKNNKTPRHGRARKRTTKRGATGEREKEQQNTALRESAKKKKAENPKKESMTARPASRNHWALR
jgi:hypothetical protein